MKLPLSPAEQQIKCKFTFPPSPASYTTWLKEWSKANIAPGLPLTDVFFLRFISQFLVPMFALKSDFHFFMTVKHRFLSEFQIPFCSQADLSRCQGRTVKQIKIPKKWKTNPRLFSCLNVKSPVIPTLFYPLSSVFRDLFYIFCSDFFLNMLNDHSERNFLIHDEEGKIICLCLR